MALDEVVKTGLVAKDLEFFDEQGEFFDLAELAVHAGLPLHDRARDEHLVRVTCLRFMSAVVIGCSWLLAGLVKVKVTVPVFTHTFTTQHPRV